MILITIVLLLLLVGCTTDGDKFNGLVLTDKNTGKNYLLRHTHGDAYFIYESITIINGKDTTNQFK